MLAAVLMTQKSKFSILEQAQTAAVMMSVLLITFLLMLLAGWINRFIGKSGASVVSRIMGVILASVATTNILSGLKTYFGI